MADKEISMLPALPSLTDETLIPVHNPGSTTPANKMTGKQFADFAREQAKQIAKGATFTPIVSANGDLGWKNDQGMENPETVNIRGPQGLPGELRLVIGTEQPAAGPILWFNTGVTADGTSLLVLTDDTDTEVQAEVEGEEYGVENASVNSEPTEGNYDFQVL